MDGLVALLREDATLRMPPQPSLSGGLQIAHFFLETVAHGDLTRIRHRPTWANGRPAVTIEVRAEDGTWIPHGISVLEIEEGQIVGIDAFLDPALLPRFGVRRLGAELAVRSAGPMRQLSAWTPRTSAASSRRRELAMRRRSAASLHATGRGWSDFAS